MDQKDSEQRDKMIKIVACVLNRLFESRQDVLPEEDRISLFHTTVKPSMSIGDYLLRFCKFSECSAEAVVLSLININRLAHFNPNFDMSSLSIHRLLLASLVTSVKFFDDVYFTNSYYAKIGGVLVKELNFLEVEFLGLINFELFTKPSAYVRFLNELCCPNLHQHCNCSMIEHPALPDCDDPRAQTTNVWPVPGEGVRILSQDGKTPFKLPLPPTVSFLGKAPMNPMSTNPKSAMSEMAKMLPFHPSKPSAISISSSLSSASSSASSSANSSSSSSPCTEMQPVSPTDDIDSYSSGYFQNDDAMCDSPAIMAQ